MSKPIIEVNTLGKQYHIGLKEKANRTFRETLVDTVAAPFKNFNRLRRLNKVEKDETPDTIWALKNVSFDVQPGEVVGIIGRNGAGKSTLLKILSRITEPTSGEIKLYGRVSSLLEVGTGFHPELTGRENIYLNGTILGMRKAEIDSKFDEIVTFSEIEKFLDTPVKRYSSGMYVRLAFAVAAHLEPEILLVDEVLAVGDAEFQKKCLGKMNDVAREGRTVLFVSHNMQAIRQLCTKGIFLSQGTIAFRGSSEETVNAYLQKAVCTIAPSELSHYMKELQPDPVIRFREVQLNQSGVPVSLVENGKPLQLTVDYEVLQKTKGLRIYFDLYDSTETLLLRSFHDEDHDGIPTVSPGRYKSDVTIPADFLSPANYTMLVRATIHNVRTCIPTEGISIQLNVERTGRSNKAYLSDPIRGKIAPYFKWNTIKTSH